MKELFREIATHPAPILIVLLFSLANYLDRLTVDQAAKNKPIIESQTPPKKTTDDIKRENHAAEIQRITDNDGDQNTLEEPQAEMQRLEHEVQQK